MPTPESDLDLVHRAIRGESLSLDRLLLRHHRSLESRIRKRLPGSISRIVSVEDVLQDTYVQAYKGISAFVPQGPDSFTAWIRRIADNALRGAIRSQRAAKRGGGRKVVEAAPNDASYVALVDLLAAHSKTPSRSASGREARRAIQGAMIGIHPEYRTALTLHYLRGAPVSEVANHMGKTDAAVHKLLSRGLQSLRKTIGDIDKYQSRS